MTVHSNRLARGTVSPANTAVTIYTCPAGQHTIVKDVRVWNSSGAGVSFVWAANSGAVLVLAMSETIAAGAVRALQPWLVLEQGDELQMSCTVNNVLRYWVSGSELPTS